MFFNIMLLLPPSIVGRATTTVVQSFQNHFTQKMKVLYTFGLNEDGQCGVPPSSDHNGVYFPAPVRFPSRVSLCTVSAGSRHTLALSDSGEVYSWGWGHLGQLGHGDAKSLAAPSKILSLSTPVQYISAGGVHSACIDTSNYCYTWGSATYGQLGLGKAVTQTRKCTVTVPTVVTLQSLDAKQTNGSSLIRHHASRSQFDSTTSLLSQHSFATSGSSAKPPTVGIALELGAPSMMRATSGGSGCAPIPTPDLSMALRVSRVSCGGMHTAAIDLRGNVYCWGKADSGQTGYADWYMDFSPAVYSPRLVKGLGPRPRASSAGAAPGHSAQNSPRSTGRSPSCSGDGPSWFGQTSPAQLSRKAFGAPPPPGAATAASSSLASSPGSGSDLAASWANVGPSSMVSLTGGEGLRAVEVSCGGFHTMVLLEDGTVYAMGKQDFGMLGTGTGVEDLALTMLVGVEAPTQVKYTCPSVVSGPVARPLLASRVSTGGWHTAFLSSEGVLYTCGKGEFGRLGLGDEKARMDLSKTRVPVVSAPSPGQAVGGEQLQPQAVEKVTLVSCGGSHTIYATESGRVFTVGRVDGGRLGFGFEASNVAPGVSNTVVKNGNTYGVKKLDRLLNPVDITDKLFPATAEGDCSSGHKVVQVSAGGSHSAVLVEYPNIKNDAQLDSFIGAIETSIRSEEAKINPASIARVK
jgi:alpha-tubulin suppressor-like RCC1 family protein